MGTVYPALAETERDKLVELINEQIARVRSGEVTGFIWTAKEEIEELESIRASLEES